METQLFKVTPGTSHWESDSKIEEFKEKERQRINGEILEQLPAHEQLAKQEAKIAKLRAEVEAAKQVELAKVSRAEHLDCIGRNYKKELERGDWLYQSA